MSEPAKPKIIMIAYYFPPAQEIGGRRPFRFYKYLRRMGFDCHVITASKPEEPCPPGVIWVPDAVAPNWNGSSHEKLTLTGNVELLLRKFLFPGHIGLAWAFEAARQCRKTIKASSGQKCVVFSTFPPMGVLLAALLVRHRMKTPWVSDFRDPMDVDDKTPHVSGWARFCNSLVERAVWRGASAVVANTEAAERALMVRYPWAASKMSVIWNGFDPEDEFRAIQPPARDHRIVVHAGALYLGRNPNHIIESFSRLRKVGAPEASAACIMLVGHLSQKAGMDYKLGASASMEGWLKMLATVPGDAARRLTEQADGLLLIQPQSSVQVPGKLYEYICIGRPILALVPRQSAVEQILERAGVPYVCVYTDDDKETTDRKLLEYLRLSPKPVPYSEWFRENFNAEHQAEQLATIFERAG